MRLLIIMVLAPHVIWGQFVFSTTSLESQKRGCLTTSLTAYDNASDSSYTDITSTEYSCIESLGETFGANDNIISSPDGANDNMTAHNSDVVIPSGYRHLAVRYRTSDSFSRKIKYGSSLSALTADRNLCGTGTGQKYCLWKGALTSTADVYEAFYSPGNIRTRSSGSTQSRWKEGEVTNLSSGHTSSNDKYAYQTVWTQNF